MEYCSSLGRWKLCVVENKRSNVREVGTRNWGELQEQTQRTENHQKGTAECSEDNQ